jgi:hypothetical protein
MLFEFKWEELSINDTSKLKHSTYRSKVIGGWVLMNNIGLASYGLTQGMVFIPDPEHRWEIE